MTKTAIWIIIERPFAICWHAKIGKALIYICVSWMVKLQSTAQYRCEQECQDSLGRLGRTSWSVLGACECGSPECFDCTVELFSGFFPEVWVLPCNKARQELLTRHGPLLCGLAAILSSIWLSLPSQLYDRHSMRPNKFLNSRTLSRCHCTSAGDGAHLQAIQCSNRNSWTSSIT